MDDSIIMSEYFKTSRTAYDALGLVNVAADPENIALAEWEPLVALRHTAQQMMIRSLSNDQPKSLSATGVNNRASTSSSITTATTITTSTSSRSEFYLSPIWELPSEYHHNERSKSHVGCSSDSLRSYFPNSMVRQRSSSTESLKESHKTAVHSSLKAAKLLGIEALSKPAPITSSDMKRPSFFSMVDTKLRMFRRSSAPNATPSQDVQLQYIMKESHLQDWVEMQRRTIRGTSSLRVRKPWKRDYLVLAGTILYRFDSNHREALATDRINLTSDCRVATSDRVQSGQMWWALEINDGLRVWFLRFQEKGGLVSWLANLKNAIASNHHRHTAPCVPPFLSPLPQVPELISS